jgi:hypothetical protein
MIEERYVASVSRRGLGKEKRMASGQWVTELMIVSALRMFEGRRTGGVCKCPRKDLGPPPHLAVAFYYFLNASLCETWILVSVHQLALSEYFTCIPNILKSCFFFEQTAV